MASGDFNSAPKTIIETHKGKGPSQAADDPGCGPCGKRISADYFSADAFSQILTVLRWSGCVLPNRSCKFRRCFVVPYSRQLSAIPYSTYIFQFHRLKYR